MVQLGKKTMTKRALVHPKRKRVVKLSASKLVK